MDRAGPRYWDEVWRRASPPAPLDSQGRDVNAYFATKFDEYFSRFIGKGKTQGKKMLEVGCADSVFLPYFAKRYGFEVAGLDYSSPGCERASSHLSQAGVSGQVYCADFLQPLDNLRDSFDVVISLGVIEHHDDVPKSIQALSGYLKPAGILITVIPNLCGLVGKLHKLVDRKVYSMHIPIDRDTLVAAHLGAKLEVEICEYFLSWDLGVFNLDHWQPGGAKRLAKGAGARLSRVVRSLNERFPVLKPNCWTSPYINSVARKRCQPPAG